MVLQAGIALVDSISCCFWCNEPSFHVVSRTDQKVGIVFLRLRQHAVAQKAFVFVTVMKERVAMSIGVTKAYSASQQ